MPPLKSITAITNKPHLRRGLPPEKIFVERGPGVLELMRRPFDEHAAHVSPESGRPGSRISDIEFVHNGIRIRYQNGAIYERNGGGMAWVHGAIEARYNQLGGASSWLGLPVHDEQAMSEGGRASVFERGAIYWWPDVGAIELNDIVIQYTGIMCFGETDADGFLFTSTEDEPYVIIAPLAPGAQSPIRSQIYQDVDSGESRLDLIEIYRGKPVGISLNVVMIEHSAGDPDEYKELVAKAVHAGAEKLTPLIANAASGVPLIGPALAVAASVAIPLVEPVVTDLLNGALGTGERPLGTQTVNLTAKDLVVLSARTLNSNAHGVQYKVETGVFDRFGGSYKAYFGVVTA